MTRRFLLLAATLVAGCAVGPDYERPETKTPAAFASADAEAYAATAEPVVEWWRTLDDPLLAEWV